MSTAQTGTSLTGRLRRRVGPRGGRLGVALLTLLAASLPSRASGLAGAAEAGGWSSWPGGAPAEVGIVDARLASSTPTCSPTAPFDVTIRNTGTELAVVAIGTTGRAPRLVERVSSTVTVRPGATVPVRANVSYLPNLVNRGAVQTTIFLVDALRPDNGTLDQLWRDDTRNDNQRNISWPLPGVHDVTVQFVGIDVHDRCDNASPGDWLVAAEGEGHDVRGYRVQQCARWNESPTDVNNGDVLGSRRSLVLRQVSMCSPIELRVYGVDCDSDTFLPTSYLDSSGTASCLTGRCSGEEFPELSGKNDRLGTVHVTLDPDRWVRGGDVQTNIIANRSRPGERATMTAADCGAAPFDVHFRLTVR